MAGRGARGGKVSDPGAGLRSHAQIKLERAARGTELDIDLSILEHDVPTLDGVVRLKVLAGTRAIVTGEPSLADVAVLGVILLLLARPSFHVAEKLLATLKSWHGTRLSADNTDSPPSATAQFDWYGPRMLVCGEGSERLTWRLLISEPCVGQEGGKTKYLRR